MGGAGPHYNRPAIKSSIGARSPSFVQNEDDSSSFD